MKNERLAWVDTLRFLGMLAIYAGHLGTAGGQFHKFVWIYHVPLFFFVSGFFAKADDSLPKMAWRLTRTLLAPYVFFALLSMTTLTLFNNWQFSNLKEAVAAFSLGTRNVSPVGSLWFFPCLFVAALGFGVVLRFTRSALAGLAFGAACLFLALHGLPFNPLNTPKWPLNVDSALYYVWWYALGYAAFPHLKTLVQQPWFSVAGAIFLLVTILVYFDGGAHIYSVTYLLPQGRIQSLSQTAIGVVIVSIPILGNIFLARCIEGVQILGEMGRRTLVMCGTEEVTKILLSQVLLMIGLKYQLGNPLQVIMYSFVCMLFSALVIGRALDKHAPKWSSLRTGSKIKVVSE
ncbi:hypothetical protein DJFAAGMI_01913 [Comamonas sp. PE63]|uniref:Acyltransferase 3 domain-containing protein n=1 Tax=Comamonas brasiliensis TaxID=1812482 RepID=A0ABS5LRP2_9BURK|nr:acyltransferase family protein [Comamonas sp. PE63]MBS3019173.1 hypothetical protein [Comamonas sp. PE63]